MPVSTKERFVRIIMKAVRCSTEDGCIRLHAWMYVSRLFYWLSRLVGWLAGWLVRFVVLAHRHRARFAIWTFINVTAVHSFAAHIYTTQTHTHAALTTCNDEWIVMSARAFHAIEMSITTHVDECMALLRTDPISGGVHDLFATEDKNSH